MNVGTGPAAADQNQADEAIARGLTGLVASATGYTTPTDPDIACVVDATRLGCEPLNRTAALEVATSMVASSVDMMSEG